MDVTSAADYLPFILRLIAFSLLAYPLLEALYNAFLHPLRSYPGPKLYSASLIPIYYHRAICGRGPQKIASLHAQYGPVVRIAPTELSYITAQAWKDIYSANTQSRPSLRKDPKFFIADADDGYLNIVGIPNDHDHGRQRKVFSNAFSERALREQESLIRRYVDTLISVLHERAASQKLSLERATTMMMEEDRIDMVTLYNLTTFDIMSDLTFGEPLDLLKQGRYTPWVDAIFGSVRAISVAHALMQSPILKYAITTFLPPSLKKARETHFRFAADKVDRRLERREEARPDIWTLVQQSHEAGNLARGEMYTNANLFMVAGTETTATLLSGLTYFLCRDSEKMDRLVREVRALKTAQDLNIASLQRLEYLQACINEALRLYPSVPIATPRTTPPSGIVIDGQYVPGNTSVGVTQWAAYHSSSNFVEAETFAPERWLTEGKERYKGDNKPVYQPFSMGPRNCLGRNLAGHEMRLIFASVLWHFDIALVDKEDLWVDQRIFLLWEKKPLYVGLTPVAR